MTYLSRIWLNPLRRQSQALLGSPEKLHAAILGGISRQPISERVLWRLESDSSRGEARDRPRREYRAELLVLTESAPSWEHLIEQAGWAHADEPQALIRDYQPLLDRLETGREFRFRLRANPVSSTRTPMNPSVSQKERLSQPRPRGVRVPHRTATHQIAWLTSRVERWGFHVLDTPDGDPALRLTARDRLTFYKRGEGEPGAGAGAGASSTRGHRVVLSTATFDGALRVTDPALARHTLTHGVGSAKAYGCGLLTLAAYRPPAETGG
ncbi:type I-E CRISPR-associated protein Cas6/Cse3/CasE [Frankia sp. CiP3]|uniref:type I-E CRISPR-associated protein Cas6/Cse3/CasE n=1 Tax=Frankia sp. CiP3 TaxID=2880971 RepID=UPI001EF45FF9|nr:type I-E CRISPR-associated protein Cas6/Cse3/CasE [Frankia sp. CiP3]